MRARPIPIIAAVVLSAMALAGCGSSSSTASPSGSSKGNVIIGAADFTEIELMAQMYSELLQAKGFTTTIKTVTNRELYEPALENGQIDVVPDYAATMAEFLNTKVNGPNAAPVATSDATTTAAALNKLANPLGLTALTPAQAVDQNAFVVSQAFATQHNLKTLSDLAALKMPITLAAVEECLTRKFCGGVLKDNYGMTIKEVLPTGFDTLPTKKAVQDGTAQLGLVGSTDATLSDFNLVILTDDKKVQLADNLTPIVGKKYANDADLTSALNSLSATLTTADLVTMIRDVDTQRELPADVAKTYLTSKGLI